MKLLITLLVTLGISMGSYGDTNSEFIVTHVTGATFLDLCKDDNSACEGLVLGYMDMHNVAKGAGFVGGDFCLPLESSIRAPQLRRIVTKELTENPESLDVSAAYGFLNAMYKAFPCEK